MTRLLRAALPICLLAAPSLLLSGCVAPVGPVQVTRFHVPEAETAARGTVRVVAAPGQDSQSIEFRSYAGAVERELTRLGFTAAPPGATKSQTVAELAIDRRVFQPERARPPVTVGGGAGTGTYGSGVGLGIGIDLSGKPDEQVVTEMRVALRDSTTGRSLWEGRANFTVSAKSPMAQTSLGAAKMTEALFKDWPGRSGETIEVK